VFSGFRVGVLVGFEGFLSFVAFCCFLWVFVRCFLCILLVYLAAPYTFFIKSPFLIKKKKMLVLRAIGYEIQFQRRKLLVEMCCFMRPIC
jgi:hypothetical protein